MLTPAVRIAFIIPLLLLAACGSSREQQTTRLLDDRLQAQLAPDLRAHNVALQRLPSGVRVTLFTTSSFPNDVKALADQYPDIRASIIEALLDPALMRLQVADTSALPDEQRDARIKNVADYFMEYGLESSPQPAAATGSTTAEPASEGLTITISVQCPHRRDGAGYGSGEARPACN